MYDIHLDEISKAVKDIPSREKIKDEIELFSRHKRVIFCTMGKSAFACRKIVYTARSYGLDWYDLDVCHAFHGDAGIIKKHDLLVFVSKSGETKETIEVAEYFKSWETVSITSNPDSSLTKMCKKNINIPVIKEASPFGYAPMISTSLYMICLHGILCEAIIERKCSIKDYHRNHPAGTIGELIMEDNKGFLDE